MPILGLAGITILFLKGCASSGTHVVSGPGEFRYPPVIGTNYDNNLDCIWELRAEDPTKKVAVNFTKFNVSTKQDKILLYTMK